MERRSVQSQFPYDFTPLANENKGLVAGVEDNLNRCKNHSYIVLIVRMSDIIQKLASKLYYTFNMM